MAAADDSPATKNHLSIPDDLSEKAARAKEEILKTGATPTAAERRRAFEIRAAQREAEEAQREVEERKMDERDAGAKNLSETEKKQIRKTRLSNPGMKAKLGYEAVDPEPWYNARKPKRTFRDQHEIEPVPFFEDTASRAPDKRPFDMTHPQCRDAGWAVLFIAHFITMCILGLFRGLPELSIAASSTNEDAFTPADSSSDEKPSLHRGRSKDEIVSTSSLLVALISLVVASLASLLLFEMALTSPTGMIQFGLGGMIFSFGLVACVQIIAGPDIIGALLWSVATAFAICFAISYQDRVPFAAANLSCATKALRRFRETIGVAVTALIAQVMWLLIWLTATLGIALQNHRERQEALPTASRQYLSYEASAGSNVFSGDDYDNGLEKHKGGGEMRLLKIVGNMSSTLFRNATKFFEDNAIAQQESNETYARSDDVVFDVSFFPSVTPTIFPTSQPTESKEHFDSGSSGGYGRNVGTFDGDDSASYYGLGPGCRNVLLGLPDVLNFASTGSLAIPSLNATFNHDDRVGSTAGSYCACDFGVHVSSGTCHIADYAGEEFRHNFWLYILLLCSLYWGGQVIAGLVHVTSAGTVAAWWFGAKTNSGSSSAEFAYLQLEQATREFEESQSRPDYEEDSGSEFSNIYSKQYTEEKGQDFGNTEGGAPAGPIDDEDIPPRKAAFSGRYSIQDDADRVAGMNDEEEANRALLHQATSSIVQGRSRKAAAAAAAVEQARREGSIGRGGSIGREGPSYAKYDRQVIDGNVSVDERLNILKAKREMALEERANQDRIRQLRRASKAKPSGTKNLFSLPFDSHKNPAEDEDNGNQIEIPVVQAALNRAMGPSFGSICLGSSLVAILSGLEAVTRYMRECCASQVTTTGNDGQERNGGAFCCCICCLDCILTICTDVMEYFNKWAFSCMFKCRIIY